jgi:hypothetical protein
METIFSYSLNYKRIHHLNIGAYYGQSTPIFEKQRLKLGNQLQFKRDLENNTL